MWPCARGLQPCFSNPLTFGTYIAQPPLICAATKSTPRAGSVRSTCAVVSLLKRLRGPPHSLPALSASETTPPRRRRPLCISDARAAMVFGKKPQYVPPAPQPAPRRAPPAPTVDQAVNKVRSYVLPVDFSRALHVLATHASDTKHMYFSSCACWGLDGRPHESPRGEDAQVRERHQLA